MSLLENNDENVMLSQCQDVFEVMENNEENVSLSRCYDDFERTGFADLDDTSLSQLIREYETDDGTFGMYIYDYVPGDNSNGNAQGKSTAIWARLTNQSRWNLKLRVKNFQLRM